MLNVLCLTEYYLPRVGGHVIWLHEVCKRLGGALVLTARAPDQRRHEIIDGVRVRRIILRRWAFLRPESLALYANLMVQAALTCTRVRPAAILAARVLPEGLIANVVGRVFRVPSVVLAHGEEITSWGKRDASRSASAAARWKPRALWNVYRKADQIVANSRFTRDLLVDGGINEDRVAIVHPGTDPARFRPMSKDQRLLGEWGLRGRKILLTVGRLSKRKGHDMVIRALPEILAAVPNAVYLIAGAGEYESVLRDLAKSLNVAPYVRFLGEVHSDELPTIYNLADVFLMPNRTLPDSNDVEGFGIVFLEASACAKPVIGGCSGGVPDAIVDGKTGVLVNGSSPGAISNAVLLLLTNSGLACRLGRTGRQRVCREFTWDHSAAKIKDLMETLAKHLQRQN